MNKVLLVTVLALLTLFSCQETEKREIKINDEITASASLIHSEDFDTDLSRWKVEQMPGGEVSIKDNALVINDNKGCTIWYKEYLEGPIMVEYDAFVIDNGGEHDRVSDLNCFWKAIDPEATDNLFANSDKRGGKFSNYDSLRLYYVGVGGHFNTKTRFRRYIGNGDRPLLPEHDLTDQKYMIKPNITNKIRIISYHGVNQYYINGELIFDFNDDSPYEDGHFGFRTVDNHMTVKNFKIYSLK